MAMEVSIKHKGNTMNSYGNSRSIVWKQESGMIVVNKLMQPHLYAQKSEGWRILTRNFLVIQNYDLFPILS